MNNLNEEMRKLMEEGYKEIEKQNRKLNEDFLNGVQAGIKLMEDKIQRHCELGKPVMANGELYWMTDSKQHLRDIMDNLDAEWEDKSNSEK